MKKYVIIIALLISTLLISPTPAKANQLPECNTSECQEYFKAYRILTKRGHSSAMAMLGELYYAGYGTDKNLSKALKWYRRAGKHGNLDAKYKAGVLYLQDTDLRDIDEGIEFLSYASRRHHARSSYLLGKLYLSGDIVKEDISMADKYFSEAYEQKDSATMKYAHILYQHPETKSLPLNNLYALVKQNVISLESAQANNGQPSEQVSFPKNEMETIEVTKNTFESVFQSHIEILNHTTPDTSRGTGSNIAGQTCAKLWACSSEGDSERIRDAMFADWGLETIPFRVESVFIIR